MESLESRLTPAITILNAADLLAGNGSTGFVLNGAASADFSGLSVGLAGDVNRDGFDDLIIGSPGADHGGGIQDGGEAYVVFGKAGGFPAQINLASMNGSNGFVAKGLTSSARLGASVSSAGDVNGDGFSDILLGAPGSTNADGETGSGRSYVIFGHAGAFGASFDLSTLNGMNGFVLDGTAIDDQSGTSVSSAGDVNGDGYDDIIIGAPGANHRGGETYVVFGKAIGFSPVTSLDDLNGTNGIQLPGTAAFDHSGTSVSSAGDVNGDWFADMIIGAPGANQLNAEDGGETHVLFGKSTWSSSTVSLASLNGSDGFVLKGAGAFDYSGISVSSAGDFNGDGFDDLLIGAPGANHGGGIVDGGEVHIIFGKSGGFPAGISLGGLNGIDGFTLKGNSILGNLGISVSAAGDVNGDGYDDLIIGEKGSAANGVSDAGNSYIVFGRSGGFSPGYTAGDPSGLNSVVLRGFGNGSSSGAAVRAAGDVNGDGFADVVIGAPLAEVSGGADAGQTYVFFGRDFLGTVTHAGDNNANTLTGTAGANVLVGGQAGDTLIGGGGSDVLIGGSGNDTIQLVDLGFFRIAAGRGFDTLQFAGATLNFQNIASSKLSGIDQVDLTSDPGPQTLIVTARDISRFTDMNSLRVRRTAGVDTITIDSNWIWIGSESQDGVLFDAYQQGSTRLLIENSDPSQGYLAANSVDPSLVDLVFSGTDGIDSMNVSENENDPNHISIQLNVLNSATFSRSVDFYGVTGRLRINALDGDDLVDASRTSHHGVSIDGGKGNDTLISGEGTTLLASESYVDIIIGGAGNDSISTGSGNDLIYGDIIMPEDGFVYGIDTILAGAGDDVIYGDGDGGEGASDLIFGNEGSDTVYADGAKGEQTALDTVYGGEGSDIIFGDGRLGANATIGDGGEGGADSLYGESGNDSIYAGGGNDYVVGGAPYQAINDDDYLYGGDGAEGANDSIYGGAGEDHLIGSLGNDYLDGGRGDDTLEGGLGSDTMIEPDGNDLYIEQFDASINIIDDEHGSDILKFTFSQGDFTSTIDSFTATSGTDTWSLTWAELNAVEIYAGPSDNRIDLSAFNGTAWVAAGDGDDTIFGTFGADILNGNGGNDYIQGNAGPNTLSGELGNDTIYGQTSNDEIYGGDGNDLLFGDGGGDLLDGSLGDDTIDGGVADDTLIGGLGSDIMIDIDGNDQYVEQFDSSDNVINDAFGFDRLTFTFVDGDFSSAIEEFSSTAGNAMWTLTGTMLNAIEVHAGSSANRIDMSAFTGDATINSAAGADTIIGSQGLTTVDAGDDNDLVIATGAGVLLAAGGPGDDTLVGGTSDDALVGGDGNDVISGSTGNDWLIGGLGNDTVNGGGGDDTFLPGNDPDALPDSGDTLIPSSGTPTFIGRITDETIDPSAAYLSKDNGLNLLGDAPYPSIQFVITGLPNNDPYFAAVRQALDIWETHLIASAEWLTGRERITVNVSIESPWINGNWNDKDNDGVVDANEARLASAGPTDFDEIDRLIYPRALVNHLKGKDTNGDTPEINMTIVDWNSQRSTAPTGGPTYYVGTNPPNPPTLPNTLQTDLTSVIVHEIGHGLGFTSSRSYSRDARTGDFLSKTTNHDVRRVSDIYESYIRQPDGTLLSFLDGTEYNNAIQSDNLFWKGVNGIAQNGNVAPKIFAPPTYIKGSSISHLDPASSGGSNYVMQPSIPNNLVRRTLLPGELGMLADMGWSIDYTGTSQVLNNWELGRLTTDATSVFSKFYAGGWGGGASEVPLVGDWNGDGLDDIGLYRPNLAEKWILAEMNLFGTISRITTPNFGGGPGETPLVADWDGDGTDEIGLYIANPTDGYHWVLAYRASDGENIYRIDRPDFGGGPGEVPLVGDWDGDGTEEIGLYIANPTDGHHWVLAYPSSDGHTVYRIDRPNFGGGPDEEPLLGDWDGDGSMEIGLYISNPTDGHHWILAYRASDGQTIYRTDRPNFGGGSGEKPLVGDWDGDGTAEIGLEISDGTNVHWVLAKIGSDGIGVFVSDFDFGSALFSTALVGDWDLDGRDDIGLYYRVNT